MKNLKCVVVGDGYVGKTCLLISYAQNKFPRDYVPTVFDNYAVTVNVGGEPYTLVLFDTAGQEEYERLRPLSYPQTNIFVVCYSVVLPSSFDNIKQKWIPEIDHHAPGVPFIIVGTQTDLRENDKINQRLIEQRQRPLSFAQGQKLAKETKAVCYAECSALTQSGIKNVFDEAILAALNRQEAAHKPKKCTVL